MGWGLQTGSPTAGRRAGCLDSVSLHLQPARLSVICDRSETGLCIRKGEAKYGLYEVCLAVMLGVMCAEAARSRTATVHVINGLCLGVQKHNGTHVVMRMPAEPAMPTSSIFAVYDVRSCCRGRFWQGCSGLLACWLALSTQAAPDHTCSSRRRGRGRRVAGAVRHLGPQRPEAAIGLVLLDWHASTGAGGRQGSP